jgi:hypothetical protein
MTQLLTTSAKPPETGGRFATEAFLADNDTC